MRRHVRAHGILSVLLLFAAAAAPSATAATSGTGFTYQGQLQQSGSPVSGSFDMRFTLYDAPVSGNVVGGPWTASSVPVAGGLFTAYVDFGSAGFNGSPRWIGVAVRPAGTGDFVPLTPLQSLTATPYALFSKAGVATSVSCAGCVGGIAIANGAVTPEKISTAGASAGQTLVFNGTSLGWQSAGGGFTLPYSGSVSSASTLLSIQNATGSAISARSGSGIALDGVRGTPNFDFAVLAAGIGGQSDAGPGVMGGTAAADSAGVSGLDLGSGAAGAGVRGYSISGYGLSGSSQHAGLYAQNLSAPAIEAYLATPGYAGDFYGNVDVHGSLIQSGANILIDHPLDPENKTLSHSQVESPDMMNIYNGNATLDASGEAIVQLPDYFEALNRDFRYQLTSIGAPAPNLHVAEPVANGRFRIAGGPRHGEVSWQVTGVRRDAWADASRMPVEQEKPELEKGYYQNPEVFGQPASKSVRVARRRRNADAR